MPMTYPATCTSVINDKDDIVLARNVILLLISLKVAHEDAVDLMLHLWYSARLTNRMENLLETKIQPLIAYVVEKIATKSDNVIHAKTWTVNKSSIAVRLYKHQWGLILKLLTSKPPTAITEANRTFVTLNESRKDHRQRHYYNMTPPMRLCAQKLRATGILLPFSNYAGEFVATNP